jgi:hypothetical protein
VIQDLSIAADAVRRIKSVKIEGGQLEIIISTMLLLDNELDMAIATYFRQYFKDGKYFTSFVPFESQTFKGTPNEAGEKLAIKFAQLPPPRLALPRAYSRGGRR